MARRSKGSSRGPTRSLHFFAKPRLFGPIRLSAFGSSFGDRRTFFPDVYRPADYSGLRLNRSLVVKPQGGAKRSYLHGLRFFNPQYVYLCARRKIRREVLFALGKGGKGSRAPKRRNEHSEVSCHS